MHEDEARANRVATDTESEPLALPDGLPPDAALALAQIKGYQQGYAAALSLSPKELRIERRRWRDVAVVRYSVEKYGHLASIRARAAAVAADIRRKAAVRNALGGKVLRLSQLQRILSGKTLRPR